MAKVVRLREPGGVDRLELAEVAVPDPGAMEIRLRQRAIGLNFVDVYQREGLYRLPAYPAVLGIEASGVVEAVGEGVTQLRPGDRVAYAGAVGAYATERLLPAWRAVPIPDSLDDATAAVLLARGITVHMLMSRVYDLRAGEIALIHSAAGGLGALLVRTAKARGATVIATVGSQEKASTARALGADHVIVGRDADFGAHVTALTDGKLAHVAYDGVGGSTLQKTLACVRPFGTVVSFGQAAGPIPKLAVEELGPTRSLMLARPSVMHFMSDDARYREGAEAALSAAASGIVPTLGARYALSDVARAHEDLEAGRGQGAAWMAP